MKNSALKTEKAFLKTKMKIVNFLLRVALQNFDDHFSCSATVKIIHRLA